VSTAKFNLYVEGRSFLHQLDPRTKLIWIPVGFALVMIFNHPAFVGAILFMALLLAFTSNLPGKPLRNVISASGFIFFASIIVYPLYLKRGPEIFSLFGIVYTRDAFMYGLSVGMRLMTMTTMSMVIIMTTTPSATVLGMEQLGLPYRGAVAMSMMVRYLPTLIVEGNTIVEAQKSRGLQLDVGNPIQRVRKYVPIIIPLFIRSFLLAKQLGLALDARGFGLHDRRTHLVSLAFTRADRLFLAFWITLLIVGVITRVLGYGVVIPDLI
jgi:energy-coupling factor transport system permease protein